MAKKPKYKIAVLDFETDPFKYGRIPVPFAAEFYCDDVCEVFWGDDCVDQFLTWLLAQDTPYMIYAHNGGKFDFHFIHAQLENPVRIINSRIVHASVGIHVVRDSLAIIPVPLRAFDKDDIDYRKMERHCREKHRPEIERYLHKDCTSLYGVVTAFVERFGLNLTVGSTAMKELIKLHDFEIMTPEQDAKFRPFYFGGRVECFQTGILEGPFKMFDLNSAYPKVMRDKLHPLTANFHETRHMPDNFDMPYFMEFTGSNRGALPMKTEDGSLDFNVEYGRFFACSHEIEVALKYGLITIDEVHICYVAQEAGTFEEYVDYWYAEKVACKLAGDKKGEMFAKFMLNSAYGKFGQSPENFKDWYINREFGDDLTLMGNGYMLEAEYEEFELWSRPAAVTSSAYYNVSIAASVTSGTRAILLEGIQNAVNPIYCDTDSLLCSEFRGNVSETELGAWKLEKTAPFAAVARKKLYALYDPAELAQPARVFNKEWGEWENNPNRKALKIASKGGQLTVDEIIAICAGDVVEYRNDAPTFSLHHETKFIKRNFKMPVDETGEIL